MILHFYRHDNTHRQEAVLLQCAHQKTISFWRHFDLKGKTCRMKKISTVMSTFTVVTLSLLFSVVCMAASDPCGHLPSKYPLTAKVIAEAFASVSPDTMMALQHSYGPGSEDPIKERILSRLWDSNVVK